MQLYLAFRVVLALCWFKYCTPEDVVNECDESSASAMPLRLRQVKNPLDLLPLSCKATLSIDSKAIENLGQILEFCFNSKRSVNYRFDVSRLGSQLKCVGGKTGCATALLPEAVVCSRAANQFGWICKSVWPQSIRVKLYPIKINCEEISPLVSLDETITNEKTETLIVKDSCRLQYRLEWRQALPPTDRQIAFRFDGRPATAIHMLSFRANAFTHTLYNASVPQLVCSSTGGSAGCLPHLLPQRVQCRADSEGKWMCRQDLDRVVFAHTQIECESYDRIPADSHFVRRSCGLRYSLDWRPCPKADRRLARVHFERLLQLTFKNNVERRHKVHPRGGGGHPTGGHYTRVHTKAQLVCSGAWCSYNRLRHVECRRDGRAGAWRCTLPDGARSWIVTTQRPRSPKQELRFAFGKVRVRCEGFDFPEDRFVRKHSCVLHYSLVKVRESLGATS